MAVSSSRVAPFDYAEALNRTDGFLVIAAADVVVVVAAAVAEGQEVEVELIEAAELH